REIAFNPELRIGWTFISGLLKMIVNREDGDIPYTVVVRQNRLNKDSSGKTGNILISHTSL
ncbi:TPA: hypothetical protein ACIC8E_004033, partial [Escherichia coli]